MAKRAIGWRRDQRGKGRLDDGSSDGGEGAETDTDVTREEEFPLLSSPEVDFNWHRNLGGDQ